MMDNSLVMLVANSLVLLVDNSLVMHYRRLLLMVNSLLKDSRIILNQILLMHHSLVFKCKLVQKKGEDYIYVVSLLLNHSDPVLSLLKLCLRDNK